MGFTKYEEEFFIRNNWIVKSLEEIKPVEDKEKLTAEEILEAITDSYTGDKPDSKIHLAKFNPEKLAAFLAEHLK
jgi:hypothetical protein